MGKLRVYSPFSPAYRPHSFARDVCRDITVAQLSGTPGSDRSFIVQHPRPGFYYQLSPVGRTVEDSRAFERVYLMAHGLCVSGALHCLRNPLWECHAFHTFPKCSPTFAPFHPQRIHSHANENLIYSNRSFVSGPKLDSCNLISCDAISLAGNGHGHRGLVSGYSMFRKFKPDGLLQ